MMNYLVAENSNCNKYFLVFNSCERILRSYSSINDLQLIHILSNLYVLVVSDYKQIDESIVLHLLPLATYINAMNHLLDNKYRKFFIATLPLDKVFHVNINQVILESFTHLICIIEQEDRVQYREGLATVLRQIKTGKLI